MLRTIFLAALAMAATAGALPAAVGIVRDDGIPTPGMPGFKTITLTAVSDDPRSGFAYLRDGLAQNCGPPWAVGVPAAGYGYRDPAVAYAPAPEPYAPAPELGQPRPLTRYGRTAVMSP